MTTVTRLTQPSRELLDEQNADAWDRYAQACHDPLATSEQRRDLFTAALGTLEVLAENDRPFPAAVT